ncbi:hypothetical protein F4553_001442 [Allocatelliglobosispora scoriae]|uniref:Uncharacterized protein n=1 Tax=Allocatelliglobosispora scoriae TaxID=643052 RepID=A0A841BM65_9ACTN|nr:hypothetical protein [Allocatelliglobosispora scoriae]MBB5868063.1 hypothetical protein [Allocatelliglobosispora scoriae]
MTAFSAALIFPSMAGCYLLGGVDHVTEVSGLGGDPLLHLYLVDVDHPSDVLVGDLVLLAGETGQQLKQQGLVVGVTASAWMTSHATHSISCGCRVRRISVSATSITLASFRNTLRAYLPAAFVVHWFATIVALRAGACW